MKESCFSPITGISEASFSFFVDFSGHSFDIFVGEVPAIPLSNLLRVSFENISTSLTLTSAVLTSPGSLFFSNSSYSAVSYVACEFQKVLCDLIFAPHPLCMAVIPFVQAPQSLPLLIRETLTSRILYEFFILIVPKPIVVSVSPQSIYHGSIITVSGSFFIPVSAACIFADSTRQVRFSATEVSSSVLKCACSQNLVPGGINLMVEVSFTTEKSTVHNGFASEFAVLSLNNPTSLQYLNPSIIRESVTSSITITGLGFSHVRTLVIDVGGYGVFSFVSISSKNATGTITDVATVNFSVRLSADAQFFLCIICRHSSNVNNSS
jgi:hypothetical protein